ncbi:glycosyltransferase [uncultured Draconibacterium sp.]|uniref:glycosyltransferase n=1 Tax=uncultured Draconibacterium sp. TaxID=1573823 RepID=UPI0029C8F88D|nr:glycosyltransferase [uncultured Draconibacterium sp.]
MKNIVFVDATHDYPLKYSAGNTKVEFMSRGLNMLGNKITIINSQNGTKNNYGIKVLHNSFSKSFLFPRKKYILNTIFTNYISLFIILRKLKKDEENFLIYDITKFYPFFVVVMSMAKFLGYKRIAIFHEWHKSFLVPAYRKWSYLLFDSTFGYFVTGILPISSYLLEKASKFNKPMLKLPALADFQENIKLPQIHKASYFLFCGHARFLRLISILLQAVKTTNSQSNIRVKLVLGGSPEDIEKIQHEIQALDLKNVEIYTSIPYSTLMDLYKNALALVLPLSEVNLQDKARFSQKIAEYLSSKRPIITVNVGVIQEYFKNRINAFICESLTPRELSSQFELVMNNPGLADEVGLRGFKLGLHKFDFRSNTKQLDTYLSNL